MSFLGWPSRLRNNCRTALIEVREERQCELYTLRTTASQREVRTGKVFEKTSAKAAKVPFVRETDAAPHHVRFAFFRRIAEAHEKCKDKLPDTPEKLQKVYDKERMVRVESHVVKSCDIRRQVASLTIELGRRTLKVQGMLGLAFEAVRLQQELARTRMETEEENVKLASLNQIVEEISIVKKGTLKLLLTLWRR